MRKGGKVVAGLVDDGAGVPIHDVAVFVYSLVGGSQKAMLGALPALGDMPVAICHEPGVLAVRTGEKPLLGSGVDGGLNYGLGNSLGGNRAGVGIDLKREAFYLPLFIDNLIEGFVETTLHPSRLGARC